MDRQEVIRFFDQLAPDWDREIEVNEEKISRILDAAGVREGVQVLDVACGTGVLFPFYAERKAGSVTAVDISPQMVKIAERKAAGYGYRVICADVEEIAGKLPKVDCCVIYNAFPHFPDPERLIGEMAGLLKPGARLTAAHGIGLKTLNEHHSHAAASVSNKMLTAEQMKRLFDGYLETDITISDDEIYIVSGYKTK